MAGDRARDGLGGDAPSRGELPEPLPYPERARPAAGRRGLFGFAVCELCWARATEPGPLALIMLIYLVVMLVGMSLYGVEPVGAQRRRLRRAVPADRLALAARAAAGRMVVPARRSRRRAAGAGGGTVALLVVSIGSTAFDGAKEGALFNNLAKDLQSFFRDLGVARPGARVGFIVGLAGAVAIVGGIWALGMEGCAPAVGADRTALARAFAHTLIPIAAGYLVAHYFSLLAYNGQDLWRLVSDPLGKGSDLFGAAETGINYGVVSATGIWYVQVVALVVGHVAALVLAHDRALELYGSPRAATRCRLSC